MTVQPSQAELSNIQKIVFVTDVPFWREQTGAQQRIRSMAQFLASQQWQVSVVYLGSFAEEPAATWEKNIANNLKFVSLIDDWQPQGFLESALWKMKCIGNSISPKQVEQTSPTLSKRLADFENPMFRQRFQDYLQRAEPEIVIVEYVTLAYLIPPQGQRGRTRFWVDTHDLLSSRCRQFKEVGWPHWIDISESEEASALNKFDGIIAIEASEADRFRSLTNSGVPVVVAGHASCRHASLAKSTTHEIAIGIIASNNRINNSEVRRFLTEVWPRVVQHPAGQPIRFILAGSICNTLGEFADLPGVKFIGTVEKLEEFYDQIQISINPIQVGTGLKIKSVEALSFGKPLIATRHAIAGLPVESIPLPFISADSADEMVAAILELSSDRARLHAKTELAIDYANRFLKPDVVYRELAEHFHKSRS